MNFSPRSSRFTLYLVEFISGEQWKVEERLECLFWILDDPGMLESKFWRVLDGLEFLDTDDAGLGPPGPRPQDYHRTHRKLKRTREHFRFRMASSRLDVSRVSEGM